MDPARSATILNRRSSGTVLEKVLLVTVAATTLVKDRLFLSVVSWSVTAKRATMFLSFGQRVDGAPQLSQPLHPSNGLRLVDGGNLVRKGWLFSPKSIARNVKSLWVYPPGCAVAVLSTTRKLNTQTHWLRANSVSSSGRDSTLG